MCGSSLSTLICRKDMKNLKRWKKLMSQLFCMFYNMAKYMHFFFYKLQNSVMNIVPFLTIFERQRWFVVVVVASLGHQVSDWVLQSEQEVSK